ncbi:aBC transporter permease protein cysTW family [Butyrivibrio sp. CAG:318]|nr:aBC transporter permease protein cysTW family [Butyrivibrio sp. CAG:318]
MKAKKIITTIVCISIWLIIWYAVSLAVGKDIFFPAPDAVIRALVSMASTSGFYADILYSMRGIMAGFIIGMLSGIMLAIPSFCCYYLEAFINIPVKVIRAVPVASFVILALLWLKSSALSTLISASMVMPIIYSQMLSALKNTDRKMLEFAKVYRLSLMKCIRYIFIPSVMPSLVSAASVAVGFAWKSGIAAEIIGLIRGSIGNELYKAKLYLETPKLFAWTITIIIVSVACEKLITLLLHIVSNSLGGSSHEKTHNN